MWIEVAAIGIAAFAIAAAITGVMRRLAWSHGVLDVPNERSSHSTPTPRGGGVAIVVAATTAWSVLALLHALPVKLLLALIVGGVAVAIVGYLDDRRPLSAAVRLAVHVAAALWALVCLGGLPAMQVGTHLVVPGGLGYVFGTLGIVWVLNLFNFMDGIDGIAASEATFVAVGGASLALLAGLSSVVPAAALVFAGACCGFLWWNWPPAKIFMGDVGSGYIGFVLAVLAVAATQASAIALLAWLILGGVFFVDATVTLVRRSLRGEHVHQAHRSHAYQWLARRWRSHRRVTVTVAIVNLLWLLPCAVFATLYPHRSLWIAIAGLTPLVLGTLAAGAGRSEDSAA